VLTSSETLMCSSLCEPSTLAPLQQNTAIFSVLWRPEVDLTILPLPACCTYSFLITVAGLHVSEVLTSLMPAATLGPNLFS
jgi:hypothetical protein